MKSLKTSKATVGISVIVAGSLFLMNESYSKEKSRVLIVRKASQDYVLVADGLKKELSSDYDFSELTIAKETPFEEFKGKVKELKPGFLVLMDNQSVDFGIKFNSEAKTPGERVKGIGLMGLNLGTILSKNEDLAGIAYESPAYSLVTQFRYLISNPVKTVTVLYRKKSFEDRIKVAREQLAKEKITLNAIAVDDQGDEEAVLSERLNGELAKVKQSGYTDAVWVLLDSALLRPKFFQEIWIPAARGSKTPFLVETESLAKKELDFGAFATTPNLPDLVGQAVQMVEAIVKDGTKPKDIGIESVVSVNKILNVSRANASGLEIKKDNLDEVKVIE